MACSPGGKPFTLRAISTPLPFAVMVAVPTATPCAFLSSTRVGAWATVIAPAGNAGANTTATCPRKCIYTSPLDARAALGQHGSHAALLTRDNSIVVKPSTACSPTTAALHRYDVTLSTPPRSEDAFP